ncbi:MAG: hypothetical protein M0Z27_06390 [Thermaerobacter sp.]|nr:hypothetical protein [Thermaerobacter sp.]
MRDHLADEQVEVRFLPVASPEAASLGVRSAPALVVNHKLSAYGQLEREEILELINQAKPSRLGIILTKPPGGEAASALGTAAEALAWGDQACIFCLSDGVLAACRNQHGPTAEQLETVLRRGGEVLVSAPHLRAGGLSPERLVPGAVAVEEALDVLVDRVMEEWDKVMVL